MTLSKVLAELSALCDQEQALVQRLSAVRKNKQSQEQALTSLMQSWRGTAPVTTLVSPTGHVFQWNEDPEECGFFLLARPHEVLLFKEKAQEAAHVQP
ncbi:hypothetical protein QCD60_24250 [Pokkaliibacter sp. MBI-7]|uniref:hypothetical protein n=1 Tax=Pokkaliibacter sp. MBI-7 TaxID=3040600 RepID=UPI00244B0013|nr:hypothetical protein [Pokkaliibacter sp. MBI-7]MDH2435642.1 hypothetical protein [Pokkaliibacter sp. MBI-7]